MQTMLFAGPVLVLMGAPFLAQAQDKAAIEQKLTSEYAVTQPTADNTDIVTAGAILVLKKDRIMMAPVSSTNFYQNTYKDGKITQNAAGKVSNALGRFSHLPGASAPAAPATRTYVPGEKMWVTKIEVKGDAVIFELLTDVVVDTRYKAALKFEFPKGSPPTVDAADKLVAEVFKVQPADDAGAGGQQQAAAPAATPAPAPAPAPAETAAPPAPIPPPPPPADEPAAPPKTIALGQTTDQVVASLGQPSKIVKLGAKEIYFYKDLKVTFTGGKVSDVQ
ncbi:MAG TPA: hypothetical protein VMB85_12285 [Bryobacteraceae bacterium]|nr:hypothetical protein [Bryobacteraceae bacterium]